MCGAWMGMRAVVVRLWFVAVVARRQLRYVAGLRPSGDPFA